MMKIMKSLKKALLDGLSARFHSIMTDESYVMATLLVPQFRLCCVPEEQQVNCRQQLLDYVKKVQREGGQGQPTQRRE